MSVRKKIKQGWGAGEPCLLCRVVRESFSDKVVSGRGPKEMMQIMPISGGRNLEIEEAASAKTSERRWCQRIRRQITHTENGKCEAGW